MSENDFDSFLAGLDKNGREAIEWQIEARLPAIPEELRPVVLAEYKRLVVEHKHTVLQKDNETTNPDELFLQVAQTYAPYKHVDIGVLGPNAEAAIYASDDDLKPDSVIASESNAAKAQSPGRKPDEGKGRLQ